MSYIGRIRDTFSEMTYHAIWQHLLVKTYGSIIDLVHPCTVTEELLEKQLPKTMTVKEALTKTRLKQKELARKLNIPILPSDRQPGFLGQAALFEVLRSGRHDLSIYVENIIEKQLTMWRDGFGLLQLLAGLCQIRRYFECEPLDIVRHVLEPLNPNAITILWDKNWMHRVVTNIQALHPFMPFNEDSYQVLKNLVKVQDMRGPSISRIEKWTGKKRTEASRLLDAVTSCGLIHKYCPVLKNTGLVRTLTKDTAPSKTLVEQTILCSSLDDDCDYFLNFAHALKESVEGKYHDLGAVVSNVDNFDLEDRIWRIPKSTIEATSLDEIYSLFHNSDLTIPDNDITPTRRDLFYIALLQSMPMEHMPKKITESVRRIAAGCDIPKEEVEHGIRNVFRKNLLRNMWSFIIACDRQVLWVCFDDTQEKTIPMLGRILSAMPMTYVSSNHEMSYGAIGVHFPSYLTCDARDVIQSVIKETDANAEVFAAKSFKRGDTANLLALIPNDE